MLAIGGAAGIVFGLACVLHWRAVLGPTLSAVAFAAGAVWAAEGLALALNWRGAASQFQTLRERGHPSPLVRALTWVPRWTPYSLTTAFRTSGAISAAYGLFLVALGVAFLGTG